MTSGYDSADPGRHHVPSPPFEDGQISPPHPEFPHAPPPRPEPWALGGPHATGPEVSYHGGPYPGSPGVPNSGYGPPQVSGPPGYGAPQVSGPPGYGVAPAGRGGRLGVIAFVLAVVLLLVAGVQTVLLVNVSRRLDATQRSAADAKADTQNRLQGLESRTGDIEGRAIDPQAVAKDVLPSVFLVEAGKAGGTAFAVGKDEGSAGTNLITNYHVVRELYEKGGRDTSLVRDDKRFGAKIIKVDPTADLALLHANEKFPRLVAAKSVPQPGQPIVVVGAPLGLESTVTTGVVSAVRPETPEGPLLQFDAAVNPGNSGGPVVNAHREVVGVTVSGISSGGVQGINFAIQISVVCRSFAIC